MISLSLSLSLFLSLSLCLSLSPLPPSLHSHPPPSSLSLHKFYSFSVESIEEISDSLCVGQKLEGDERVVLFLKMANGRVFSDDVVKRVKTLIRTQLSARHVPAVILQTSDIPVSIQCYHSYYYIMLLLVCIK